MWFKKIINKKELNQSLFFFDGFGLVILSLFVMFYYLIIGFIINIIGFLLLFINIKYLLKSKESKNIKLLLLIPKVIILLFLIIISLFIIIGLLFF
jgi:uncharacterized membrane protein